MFYFTHVFSFSKSSTCISLKSVLRLWAVALINVYFIYRVGDIKNGNSGFIDGNLLRNKSNSRIRRVHGDITKRISEK